MTIEVSQDRETKQLVSRSHLLARELIFQGCNHTEYKKKISEDGGNTRPYCVVCDSSSVAEGQQGGLVVASGAVACPEESVAVAKVSKWILFDKFMQ